MLHSRGKCPPLQSPIIALAGYRAKATGLEELTREQGWFGVGDWVARQRERERETLQPGPCELILGEVSDYR